LAARKGRPPEVTEQQFSAFWSTLADMEKRAYMDLMAAMASPDAPTAVPALMRSRPEFATLMAKFAQAKAAALPKGTSGFGDYHHGAY